MCGECFMDWAICFSPLAAAYCVDTPYAFILFFILSLIIRALPKDSNR